MCSLGWADVHTVYIQRPAYDLRSGKESDFLYRVTACSPINANGDAAISNATISTIGYHTVIQRTFVMAAR